MTRRVVLGVFIIGLVLAAALAPWTISSRWIADAVARQIEPYGLRVAASGRSAIALLPVPRIKVSHVTLTGPDGNPVLSNTQFRGELDIASLLTGTLAVDDLTVRGGRLSLALPTLGEAPWLALLAHLRTGASTPSGGARPVLRRLTLAGVAIGTGDAAATFDKLDLFALRSAAGGLAGTASLGWRGQRIEASLETANLDRLLAGGRQSVDVSVKSALATLSASGPATLGERIAFDGPVSLRTGSMGKLLAWLEPGPTPAELDRPLSIAGIASLRDREVAWPQVRIDLGVDRLDGALSARFDAAEPAFRATLAAGSVDLGWAATLLREPLIGWVAGTRASPLPPRAVVDFRLSASDATLGTLRLRDGAASVLVESGRLDLSLLRATVAGGTVKGRLSTALDENRSDLKGQLALDRVDVAEVLRELALPSGLSGIVQAQAVLEAPADDGSDLRGRLAGRMTASLRDGEIAGLDTAETWRRASATASGPAPLGPIALGSGRTPFSKADVQVTVQDGIARVTSGSLEGGAVAASLGGQVSLASGTVNLSATLPPAAGKAPLRLVVRLDGPWSASRATGSVEAVPTPASLPEPAPASDPETRPLAR